MNLDRFEQLVKNPRRTRVELEQLLRNAIEAGSVEYATLAKEVLDQKFPGRQDVRSRRGGRKPTVARFLDKTREFGTSKEAYVWMVERFAAIRPDVFQEPSSDTLYLAFGKRRNYFAKSPTKLFEGTPELANDANHFARLTNGWFVNLNMSNAQKFDILSRLAAITRLSYLDKWDWEVLDPTDALIDKQRAKIKAQAIMEEFKRRLSAKQERERRPPLE